MLGGAPSQADVDKDVVLRVSRPAGIDNVGELLRKHHISDWAGAQPPNPLVNWIPLILMTGVLGLLLVFMIRRMGGGLNISGKQGEGATAEIRLRRV